VLFLQGLGAPRTRRRAGEFPSANSNRSASSKKVAARTNDIAAREKPAFLRPLWPVNPLCIFFGRIENMVIATVLFLAFIVATGAGIVKAYEWHQDVLFGPYLKRID
jgi:L-cystine uptake protein TcyP (sodium:dicarboxylate symporter family)